MGWGTSRHETIGWMCSDAALPKERSGLQACTLFRLETVRRLLSSSKRTDSIDFIFSCGQTKREGEKDRLRTRTPTTVALAANMHAAQVAMQRLRLQRLSIHTP